jgi:hypothetical protein
MTNRGRVLQPSHVAIYRTCAEFVAEEVPSTIAAPRRVADERTQMNTLVPPPPAYPRCRSPITLPPMSPATATPTTTPPATSALYSIETHGQLEPHVSQEWLLTNGLGGFASSSVVGCNTRRYHGVLVAATSWSPPSCRRWGG